MSKKYLMGICILLLTTIIIAGSAAAQNTSANSGASQSNNGPTNIVVDFSQTELNAQLSAGDSGVMNLVIKNAGGQDALNVEVFIPTTGSVIVDKRQFVGQIRSGESKLIQLIVRIDPSARAGLNVMQARISFDGYNVNGKREDGQNVVWEIPITVYSNPSFQIAPKTTTYYKDTLGDLTLDGSLMQGVRNLEATLSSSCVTVIGSSHAYVGDIGVDQNFQIKYIIKPTVSGACPATLDLTYSDQSGGKATATSSFGLNVQDVGVDFKLTSIEYNPTGPGSTVNVSLTLDNVGGANADDTTVSLGASDPFAPMDTLEKYIGTVGGGKQATVMFPLSVSFGAATQTYTIPVTITYSVGGTTYTSQKTIGINVAGTVILSIINVDASTGTPRIDVANLGSRDASSVKATLIIPNTAGNATGVGAGRTGANRTAGGATGGVPGGQGGQGFNGTRQGVGNNFGTDLANSQSYVVYKSAITAGKDSTFAFTGASGTGVATLVLEYSGENNQRLTQREMVTLGGRTGSTSTGRTGTTAGRGGTDYTTMGLYAVGAIIVLFAGYKLYKRRKKK